MKTLLLGPTQQKQEAGSIVIFREIKRHWAGIAAAAIILLSAGVGYYRLHSKQNDNIDQGQVVQTITTREQLILPNTNKTILTLSSGSQTAIDDLVNGYIFRQGQADVKKIDTQLIYSLNSRPFLDTTSHYNTVSIHRGGQYTLTLSDGSRVWINAESKLRYPSAFNGRERRVELIGEAFFDVTKDSKRPFIVETNGTEVEVKGTVFNIKSYPGDSNITTTLIQGAVVIKHESKTMHIKPSEQAIVSKHKIAIARNIDTERFIAWKNKTVNLEGENIRSIMVQISRLYDVDYEIIGNPQVNDVANEMKKTDSLATFLENLDLALSQVTFELQGRRIIVREQH